MSKTREKNSSVSHKILTVIGVILCAVMIPILLINITLIIKSYTNKDEVPKFGGYCPLIVLTGSMEPEISSGDLIICKQIDAGEVAVGDVIAFFDPDSTGQAVLTHRVIEIIEENGVLSFRTKGDANNTEDRLPVPETDLVGTYKFRIAGAGNVAMFMQTTAGLIVCVVLPLILLVGWDIIRRRRFEAQNRLDTAELLAELEALKAQKDAEKDVEKDAEKTADRNDTQ